MNTSNVSRINLDLLNQIYTLVQDILKLFIENMHLEICYSFSQIEWYFQREFLKKTYCTPWANTGLFWKHSLGEMYSHKRTHFAAYLEPKHWRIWLSLPWVIREESPLCLRSSLWMFVGTTWLKRRRQY